MEYQDYERMQLYVSREILLKNAVENMGLKCIVDRLSEHVAIAALYAQGDLVSEGAGKGGYCELGAIAEALEHCCLQDDLMAGGHECSILVVSSQEPLCRDGVIRNLSAFDGGVECVGFEGFFGGREVMVPKVLVSPGGKSLDKPCEIFLERYSTNSGSAFGCTLEEALLHGVNEVVERHVLSLLMLDSIGESVGLKIYEISPYVLKGISSSLGVELAGSVRVYFVSGVFDSFFCLAVRDRECCEFVIPQIGSGCSQYFELALSRAIFELNQAEALYGYEERLVDEQAVRIMEVSKRFEGLRLLRPRRAQMVYELPASFCVSAHNPKIQLERVCLGLKLNGYEVCFRVMRKINEFAYVVQVYVPGMERFNLIRSGKWVAPQESLLSSFV